MRIRTSDGCATCQQTSLITIVDITNSHPPGERISRPGEAIAGKNGAEDNAVPSHVRLLVDPVFYRHAKGALDAPYRKLPEQLICGEPKDHPYALGLLVYLRQAWQEDGEKTQGVIQRSTLRIFQEAGFWLKDNARYRSIEAMKRDLTYLKEQGWLGAWRITRAASRDAMDDTYRLQAPNGTGATEPRRAPGRGEASVSI